MGKGNSNSSLIVLALCVCALALWAGVKIRAVENSVETKPVVTVSSTDKAIEMTELLHELKAGKSSMAPVDCEALYDLLQAAQAVYLEQCPGV